MAVTVESIKALRTQTGAGIMDAKRALEDADGDMSKAQDILRELGIASAAKKASRATNEGIVESYIHSGGRVGVIVEINCETDFVARTDEFKALAHDLAMQIAAMDPLYVDASEVPEDAISVSDEQLLLKQAYIRDPSKTVQDLVNETVGRLSENIKVRRFARFSLGE